MNVEEFVLDRVMNRRETEDGVYWWAALVKDMNTVYEGYMVLWPDGNHIHTYRYPPDVWG